MQILTPGHKYIAANFEDPASGQTIQFIEKDGALGETLTTVNDGTTNEELLRVLIDRMNFLNGKFPCVENYQAIIKLNEALFWLEKRTADRKTRGVEGKQAE